MTDGSYNCPLAMTDGAARLIECSEDAGLRCDTPAHGRLPFPRPRGKFACQ